MAPDERLLVYMSELRILVLLLTSKGICAKQELLQGLCSSSLSMAPVTGTAAASRATGRG